MDSQLDEEGQSNLTRSETTEMLVRSLILNGDIRDRNWVRGNITSIRSATKDGQHSSMLYPACGTDILRPILAYGLDEITAIDSEPYLVQRFTSQLTEFGIPFKLIDVDSTTKEVTCKIDGEPVRVVLITADARLPNSNIPPRTDVLHIYFPTGAQVDEEDINNPNRWNISSSLTANNLNKVNVDGFLVLDEKPIVVPHGLTPPSLLEIAGVQQVSIQRRNPKSVMTSWYPTEEELANMDKTGSILHKKRDVPAKIIELVEAGIDNSSWAEYVIMELQRANFKFINLEEPQDIPSAISLFVQKYVRSAAKIASEMKTAGVNVELADQYVHEFTVQLIDALKRLQDEFSAFLDEYNRIAKQVQSGALTEEEALDKLGIVDDKYFGGYKSEKWEIAIPYLSQNGEKVHEHISAFIGTNIDQISTTVENNLQGNG